jgi:hypothetical protein
MDDAAESRSATSKEAAVTEIGPVQMVTPQGSGDVVVLDPQGEALGAIVGAGVRQDFEPAGQEEQQQPAQPQAPAPAAEPPYVAELERLAQLRDQGILTPDEFEAKKRQLLGI